MLVYFPNVHHNKRRLEYMYYLIPLVFIWYEKDMQPSAANTANRYEYCRSGPGIVLDHLTTSRLF